LYDRKGGDYSLGTYCKGKDAIVNGLTLAFSGRELLTETHLVLNHGHRYGLLEKNGDGKSVSFVFVIIFINISLLIIFCPIIAHSYLQPSIQLILCHFIIDFITTDCNWECTRMACTSNC
jgi:hypothetical protein